MLQTINFSQLKTIDPVSVNSAFDSTIFENPLLTTLNLPVLETVTRSFSIDENTSITTISLPALVSVDDRLQMFNNTSLTTVSLSSITNFESLIIAGSDSLSSASVNAILAQLVAINPAITNKIINLSGGPATGQGVIDAQTLSNMNDISVPLN